MHSPFPTIPALPATPAAIAPLRRVFVHRTFSGACSGTLNPTAPNPGMAVTGCSLFRGEPLRNQLKELVDARRQAMLHALAVVCFLADLRHAQSPLLRFSQLSFHLPNKPTARLSETPFYTA